jgi:hypothetical protein
LMTPKSLVYMVVAVFVGYMLVSAVPGQVAMYTVPSLSGEKGDTITLTGSGFSPENESSSVDENGSVVLYWDKLNLTDGREFSVDNETIYFDVAGSNESIAGSFVIVEGRGFSAGNESISGNIEDLSADIEELSEFEVESGEVYDIAEVAADAVAAAEAAADAVSSVASTAGEASEAAADAADAASALKSARSGYEFMGTMVWLTVDVFIALIVYWFAKRRFA